MVIDYASILDKYPEGKEAVSKGNGRYTCVTCRKTLDEKQFFKTSRVDKFKAGILCECKTCATMGVDDTNQLTFLNLLKEVNIPFIPNEWRILVSKKSPTASSVIGKYISKMHLNQFKRYSWKDSGDLVQREKDDLIRSLQQENLEDSVLEAKVNETMNMDDLAEEFNNRRAVPDAMPNDPLIFGLTPLTSKYGLTAQEIMDIKRTWGEDYTEDQYLNLEQQFVEMQESYVTLDPIAVSNVRFICKLTLKLNMSLDLNDFESAAKISRQLDLFIKTTNLAPVQQKDRQQTTFAISQMAFLTEREGFIPDFDTTEPLDKVDLILKDMHEFTLDLFNGERGIGEMFENVTEILRKDSLPEAKEDDENDFSTLEAELLGDIEAIEEEDFDEGEGGNATTN